MKKKSLQLLIKRQKILIDQLSAQVAAKKEEVEHLALKRQEFLDTIAAIDTQEAQTIAFLSAAKEYVRDLFKQIEAIEKELQLKQRELETLKKELQERFGEKKAYEKLLTKIEEKEIQEEITNESRLADESFARKFIAHS